MEYRSLRAAFQSTSSFVAKVPESSDDLLTVMDQALFFASHVVDINIQLQELLLEIKKHLIVTPSDLLLYLQQVIKRAELLKQQLISHQAQYLQPLPNAEQGRSEAKTFVRFYSKVAEKLFKKFLYYSLNRRQLHFMVESLMNLFELNETIRMTGEVTSFEQYWKVMATVTDQNFQIINLLLEAIVEEGYVNSVEEFASLMGIMYKNPNEYGEPATSREEIEEEVNFQRFENDPLKCLLKNKRRTQGRKREGKVFNLDFKKQLEVILTKYENRQSRRIFLQGLSREIQKELGFGSHGGEISQLLRKPSRKRVVGEQGHIRRKSKQPKRKSVATEEPVLPAAPQVDANDRTDGSREPVMKRDSKIGAQALGIPQITNIVYGAIPSAIHQPRTDSPINRPAFGYNSNKLSLLIEEEYPIQRNRPTTVGHTKSFKKSKPKPIPSNNDDFRSRRVRIKKRVEEDSREHFRRIFERFLDKEPVTIEDGPLIVVSRGIDKYVERFQGELEKAVASVIKSNGKLRLSPRQNKQNTTLVISEIQSRMASRKQSRHAHGRPTLLTEVTNKMSRTMKLRKADIKPELVKSLKGTRIKCGGSADTSPSSFSKVYESPKQDHRREPIVFSLESNQRPRQLYHTHLRKVLVRT